MRKLKTFARQLSDVLDLLSGAAAPYQPLPEAFFQQPDWHEAARLRHLPAIWRRAESQR